MSDQQAPPSGDTPAVAGPEQAPGTAQDQPPYGDPNDPYEKRYNDLRSWTDNVARERAEATQRAREFEERNQLYDLAMRADVDEDTRRQALADLGYEIPAEEDPEPAEYEDPYDELRAEVNDVRQQLTQREQAEQEAREGQIIDQMSREQLRQMGLENEEDQDLVLGYAINALPAIRQPPGAPVRILPYVKGAFEFFQNRETERQKSWVSTKRAPYVPPGGQPATEVPDLSTHDGRVAYAMQKIAESQDQQ